MPVSTTVIICTRNRADHLHDTLAAVNQLAVPEYLAPKLLVVDNASTDSTSIVLDNPPVENIPARQIVEPSIGAARARNTALREASGQILLWLDDDVRVPPDWLVRMTKPILEDHADAVAGKVTLAPHLRRSWMKPFHRATLASTESIDPEAPKDIISANMAISRRVLEKVSRFDPELGPGRLGTMEDTLFSWQLREAGYRIEMVTEAAVEHHFDEKRLTRDGFVRAAISRGRSLSYIRYHWLHRPQKDWTHRDFSYQVWRQPQLILIKRLVDREVRRWAHWLRQKNGAIDKEEFWAVINLYNLKQYLAERTRPRNYRERGLAKLRGEML
jgi:GT2 family glycosyltransferase